MPRQLTPEELKIIRQTEQEGEELAKQAAETGGGKSNARRMILNLLILALVFVLFVWIAYLIVHNIS